MTAAFAVFLVLVGAGTGVLGTLIGLGGGFILVPLLLFLHPDADPRTITGISLAVVFFNAFSGSVAYGRMRRIDYGIAIPYALATVPGAVLGAGLIAYISRELFTFVFGVFLIGASVLLVLRPQRRLGLVKGNAQRVMVDSSGKSYVYGANLWAGLGLSFLAGFLASLLGLGGGIVHMPVLITLLQMPVHVAAATSQFVLAITSLSAGVTHLLHGVYGGSWSEVLLLSLGVVAGAQFGARLSSRLRGATLVRLLALVLFVVGLRLLVDSFIR